MNYGIMNVVVLLIGFCVFVFLQALLINGLKETMREGMILQWFPVCIKKVIKNEFWHKGLFSCIQCMGGAFGLITFWSVVIPVFGFCYKEIGVSIADCFILVFVNGVVYKKL